ncbi:MAG: hypothetical protein ACW97V_03370 [Promethearchaeota archaeon]
MGDPKFPQLAAQETFIAEWLENPTFDDPIEPTWYSEIEGDFSDVNTSLSPGYANFDVLGDVRTFSEISGTPLTQDWIEFNHSVRPLPLTHNINQYGLNVSHAYDEGNGVAPNSGDQTANLAGVLWKRNITMPVDMSDYVITSASVSSIVNGSADQDIETPNDLPIMDGGYSSLFDHTFFYVGISDLYDVESYQIASYRTDLLGEGRVGRTYADYSTRVYLNDTAMIPLSESDLIFFLNQIFEHDPYNFTMTLGIEIDCEDNYPGYELDYWYSLLIKSCDFMFTYEKKIDQFTTISWRQEGDQISDISNDTIVVDEAILNFEYKIDKVWPATSPNSEIRVFINNNKIPETVKLSTANLSFQIAKLGGFDVTSLIPHNTEINVSIQVYIADEFNLDERISLSIDNVYLNITYTVTFPDIQTNLQIFFNGNNKTVNPVYEHPINQDINITVKYPDSFGFHIPGAIVQLSGNLTGTLFEDIALEQYTIIVSASNLLIGDLYFDVVAHRINYEARKISPILIVTTVTTDDLQLLLNGQNKTSDPFMDIALNKQLNITVKYKDPFGTHVPGAIVELTGDGIFETLFENPSLEHYSLVLNTTIKFSLGINELTITAQESEYQEKTINPRITVRKINAEITAVPGGTALQTFPGGDAVIKVFINDTDFNEMVKGATVTFSWDGDPSTGLLIDSDLDGIYEATLSNIPKGTHSIIINAFGSDIYHFESQEIIITAVRQAGNTLLFQILTIIGIIAAIIVGGYLYAYQKVLKFPKTVRKVRKYRKKLKSKNPPNVPIKDRKKSISSAYQKELRNTSKSLKGKSSVDKAKTKKPPIETKPKIENLGNDSISGQGSSNKGPKTNQVKQRNITRKFKNTLRGFQRSSVKLGKNFSGFYKSILLIILIFSIPLIFQFGTRTSGLVSENSNNIINNLGIGGQQSFTTQWLNNTSFDDPIQPTWFPLFGSLGDNSDVNATTGTGQVNFEVRGESQTFANVSGVPKPEDGWNSFNNSYFITPDYFEIDSSTGVMASHTYDESVDQSRNRPSIHWRRNITMPVNMSEYIITSASVSAVVNGSADTNVETPGDDLTTGGAGWSATYYDYARFYVQISNLDYEDLYEVAYYQTVNLGQGDQTPGGSGTIDYLTDTLMNVIEESVLKFYLTRALEKDNFHFGITLGIDVYTEDNYNVYDLDIFQSLRINSVNLTFSYEKRMNELTSVSWNQNADKISDLSNDTVIINEAKLNFKYKIDQDWPTTSPNSEIRILFNDNLHPETIKLSTATASYQLAKSGGFDVTSLITDDVNLSIQLFLADSFGLNRTITTSIDDVTLNISYTIIFPDKETDLHLFLNNDNRTVDPNFELTVGQQLNLTIKYLNQTGDHITNAIVLLSGNFTGSLTENASMEQYSIILDTDISNVGINFLTITAQANNYQLQKITPTITINKITTNNLQVFLNSANMTHDPNIALVVGEELNITINYRDELGAHIPNATVRLISTGLTKNLNESLTQEQYTVMINTSDRFNIGGNLLTIEAKTSTFQTKYAYINLYIQKINVEIDTITGINTIIKNIGQEILLQINLTNTDFGGLMKNALVTYVSDSGKNGIIEDIDNDGIYEVNITGLPEGAFTFTVSAIISDDYNIQDFEITIIVLQVSEDSTLFQILFILSIILVSALGAYLIAYYTYLKYPRPVRKVRKYRKTLRRKNDPNVVIVDREKAIRLAFTHEFASKIETSKPKSSGVSSQPVKPTKPPTQRMESEQLAEKSIEKKKELDDIISDSTK